MNEKASIFMKALIVQQEFVRFLKKNHEKLVSERIFNQQMQI